jgi:hypothetical protein
MINGAYFRRTISSPLQGEQEEHHQVRHLTELHLPQQLHQHL